MADDTRPWQGISIELNAVQQLEDNSCRLIFVANNGTGTDIEKMSAETVLFNQQGSVSRFTLFDFRELPDGKTRVRQFDLADTECSSVTRILINGTSDCTVNGQESTACVDGLAVSSKTGVEFIG
ncbi:MAG: hypothetical protein AAFR39_08490 [Pseudomonadota bacterium]